MIGMRLDRFDNLTIGASARMNCARSLAKSATLI
jgi:hypothetical protein